MKKIRVKELMVPLAEYITISLEDTLYDALLALEKAQAIRVKLQKSDFQPFILVYDKNQNVVGRLGRTEILSGLEPKYAQEEMLSRRIQEAGIQDLRYLIKKFSLWDKPLTDICKKASKNLIKDFMPALEEYEFIDMEETIDVAINQLLMGNYPCLLVRQSKQAAGVLELADVYNEICKTMKECHIGEDQAG